MNILAVDTALGACSVAVLADVQIRAHRLEPMDRGHAEALAPMVDDAITAAGMAFGDIDRLAVTTGPGTFTGQRVGLAFMRGLRVALNRPLVGVSTLHAMAVAASNGTGRSIAMHDARRDEVYFGMSDGDRETIGPQILNFEDALREIAVHDDGGIVLCGTAAKQAASRLHGQGRRITLSAVRYPDAVWVARLAAQRAPSDVAPKPLYLRAPDAKLPA